MCCKCFISVPCWFSTLRGHLFWRPITFLDNQICPFLFSKIIEIFIFSLNCSVSKSCLTPCDPMDCSVPGFSVLHYLPELAQTHVHWVGDAIQPSHPLSSPSPPAFNLSQHQGLFKWVSSSHQVGTVLELQLQHQSFKWIFRIYFLHDWLVWFYCCPRDSQESSPAPQFKSINSLTPSLLYGPTFTSIQDYRNIYIFFE